MAVKNSQTPWELIRTLFEHRNLALPDTTAKIDAFTMRIVVHARSPHRITVTLFFNPDGTYVELDVDRGRWHTCYEWGSQIKILPPGIPWRGLASTRAEDLDDESLNCFPTETEWQVIQSVGNRDLSQEEALALIQTWLDIFVADVRAFSAAQRHARRMALQEAPSPSGKMMS